MDDFPTRVKRYLKDGEFYHADRARREGLFEILVGSPYYEFWIRKTHGETRVVIAGGDTRPHEFTITFRLQSGHTRSVVTDEMVIMDVEIDIIGRFDDRAGGQSWNMTDRSAAALYNLAAGHDEDGDAAQSHVRDQ